MLRVMAGALLAQGQPDLAQATRAPKEPDQEAGEPEQSSAAPAAAAVPPEGDAKTGGTDGAAAAAGQQSERAEVGGGVQEGARAGVDAQPKQDERAAPGSSPAAPASPPKTGERCGFPA